jgi:hypothetical protein
VDTADTTALGKRCQSQIGHFEPALKHCNGFVTIFRLAGARSAATREQKKRLGTRGPQPQSLR